MILKKTCLSLVTYLLVTSYITCAPIKVYEKKYLSQDTFLYTNLKLDTIFGKLLKNDEVLVIKRIAINNSQYCLVKTKNNRQGVIKDVLVEEPLFKYLITFNSSKSSYILYNLKYKKIFRAIKNFESFNIEEKPRAEDSNYYYYYTDLKYFLKISKFDNYSIEKKGSELND